ncbi:DUF4365 domain-containing protein [Stenotrophomonas maltophilia group sp. LNF259]
MDEKKQMEEFQYAYVAALGAHAGLNRSDFRVDDDSVDVQFTARGLQLPGLRRSPIIQLQLKCTTQAKFAGGFLSFDLKMKNYDDLRANTMAPRYLAVLVVPVGVSNWLTHGNGFVSLQNECYWLSLKGMAPVPNTSQVVLKIPIANRLTTSALIDMIKAASNGASI